MTGPGVLFIAVDIANAVMRETIEGVCRRAGFKPPVICTPEELTIQEDV
jgi:hypothetical protein